jgi:uncharacterized membrane protein YhiD involved in acid resistance
VSVLIATAEGVAIGLGCFVVALVFVVLLLLIGRALA